MNKYQKIRDEFTKQFSEKSKNFKPRDIEIKDMGSGRIKVYIPVGRKSRDYNGFEKDRAKWAAKKLEYRVRSIKIDNGIHMKLEETKFTEQRIREMIREELKQNSQRQTYIEVGRGTRIYISKEGGTIKLDFEHNYVIHLTEDDALNLIDGLYTLLDR